WGYAATHTVTQLELNNNGGGDGDIDNLATADSNETGPDTASAAVIIDERPITVAASLLADEDQITNGNNDVVTGDDAQLDLTGSLGVNWGADSAGATISFSGLHLTAVGASTSGTNQALSYFWDGSSTLYASTNTTSLASAQLSAAFKIQITNAVTSAYTFTLKIG